MDILKEQLKRTKELMGLLTEQEEKDYKWEGYITHEFGPYHERDGEKTNKIKILRLKLVDNTGKKIKEFKHRVGFLLKPYTTESGYEDLVSDAEDYVRRVSFIDDSTVIPELKDFKIEISAEDLKRPIDDATQKKIDKHENENENMKKRKRKNQNENEKRKMRDLVARVSLHS